MSDVEIIELIVPESSFNQRVDKVLAELCTDYSRSQLQKWLKAGDITIDGRVMVAKEKVKGGEQIVIHAKPIQRSDFEPENIPLDILFEDDYLIVLNKPSGMTVHPAPGSRSATLVNALLYHCADTLSGIGGVMRPGIVHRLDKDTSGVMVAAKTDKAHQGLSKQFAKHSIDRIYMCLVRGAPKPRSGRIASRLARSPNDRKKQSVVKGTLDNIESSDTGRHAITHYRYVKGYGKAQHASVGTPKISQLECQLETGRTHQIRVHLSHVGCPLLGDPLYGKQRAYATSNQAAEEAVRIAVADFKRQALHARHLGFIHPITKEHHSFDAPVPPDMQHLLDVLADLPEN